MRQRTQLILVILVILAFLLLVPYGFYKTEFQKKPIIQEKILTGDAAYLYDFYLTSNPSSTDRIWYGNPDAPITIIAFLDLDEPSSATFMQEIFPLLDKDYFQNGTVRYLHKHGITADDINEKTAAYQYAVALACVGEQAPDQYYVAFQRFLTRGNVSTIRDTIQELGVDMDLFQACLDSPSPAELVEDSSEMENLAIVGINPRFYIGIAGTDNSVIDGVPAYRRFQTTIRQAQLIIGD